MNSPRQPLTSAEHRRLINLIEAAAPHLLPLAQEADGARWLTDEECDALATVLIGVFEEYDAAQGRGTRATADAADDLAGRLEMQRLSYWSS